jgi:hypothetical protein
MSSFVRVPDEQTKTIRTVPTVPETLGSREISEPLGSKSLLIICGVLLLVGGLFNLSGRKPHRSDAAFAAEINRRHAASQYEQALYNYELASEELARSAEAARQADTHTDLDFYMPEFQYDEEIPEEEPVFFWSQIQPEPRPRYFRR